MDFIDGSGLWVITDGGGVPPTPVQPAGVGGGSAYGPLGLLDDERKRKDIELAILMVILADD